MRFIFGLSITLNLFLLTTMVAARVDSTRESNPGRLDAEQLFQFDVSAVEERDVEEVDDLIEVIQRTTLGMKDLKALTLGWLVDRYRRAFDPAGPAFWQSEYAPHISAAAMRITIEQQVRDALIRIFGQAAASDSAFDSVFNPLGFDYAFLDSAAQLDLQKNQLALIAARDTTGEIQAARMAVCLSDNRIEQTPASWVLPTSFSAAAATEYRLRFSPLAQQLRVSAVAADEQEFRTLFELFGQLERNPSPQAQAQLRADLRATMGNANFDRLWSQRDPFFSPIEEFLVAEGFSAHQVQAAYSVVNRAQESLLRLMARGANPESTMSAIAKIKQDESADLIRLIGDRAAAGLSAAMSQAAVRFSDTPVGRC